MTAWRLHADISGPPEGPVVVLGHSLGATRRMWQPQLPALAVDHRVITLDLRGHGCSPAPPGPYRIDQLGADVLETLHALGVGRFSWIGLSLGGMIGMWLASEIPARVDRLALLCTSAQLGPPAYWAERAAAVRTHGTGVVAEPVVQRWFTDDFKQRHPDVVAAYVAMVGSIDAEGYAGCCDAIRDMDLSSRLPAISAPTLVVAGENDLAIPVAHAERIASLIPGSHLAVIAPAAHLANVEAAERVTALLVNHLNGGQE